MVRYGMAWCCVVYDDGDMMGVCTNMLQILWTLDCKTDSILYNHV